MLGINPAGENLRLCQGDLGEKQTDHNLVTHRVHDGSGCLNTAVVGESRGGSEIGESFRKLSDDELV